MVLWAFFGVALLLLVLPSVADLVVLGALLASMHLVTRDLPSPPRFISPFVPAALSFSYLVPP